MGQRDIRRLLIIGAMSRVRWAVRNSAPAGSWLKRTLAKKPRMVVAIALANKMARAVADTDSIDVDEKREMLGLPPRAEAW